MTINQEALARGFELTRQGWVDGVSSFDSRFPTIQDFIDRFGIDALDVKEGKK